MLMRYVLLSGLLAGITITMGCDPASKERDIQVRKSNDPLEAPRELLKRYAKGQPLGSEVTSFEGMVREVRKVDTKRADILEKGLARIKQAKPSERAVIAKQLLKALAPSMN